MTLCSEFPRRSLWGFTLVEIIAVVSLIAILGTGALLGFRRSAQNANFQKVVRDLSAIDLAKQTWVQYHPDQTWPTGPVAQWSCLTNYLRVTGTLQESPLGSGYFYLTNEASGTSWTPAGYTYTLADPATPAQARLGVVDVLRPK